jgi:hypothetical protein
MMKNADPKQKPKKDAEATLRFLTILGGTVCISESARYIQWYRNAVNAFNLRRGPVSISECPRRQL